MIKQTGSEQLTHREASRIPEASNPRTDRRLWDPHRRRARASWIPRKFRISAIACPLRIRSSSAAGENSLEKRTLGGRVRERVIVGETWREKRSSEEKDLRLEWVTRRRTESSSESILCKRDAMFTLDSDEEFALTTKSNKYWHLKKNKKMPNVSLKFNWMPNVSLYSQRCHVYLFFFSLMFR